MKYMVTRHRNFRILKTCQENICIGSDLILNLILTRRINNEGCERGEKIILRLQIQAKKHSTTVI